FQQYKFSHFFSAVPSGVLFSDTGTVPQREKYGASRIQSDILRLRRSEISHSDDSFHRGELRLRYFRLTGFPKTGEDSIGSRSRGDRHRPSRLLQVRRFFRGNRKFHGSGGTGSGDHAAGGNLF